MTEPALTLYDRLRTAMSLLHDGAELDEPMRRALIEDIRQLMDEHTKLKQEAARLRSGKRTQAGSMDSMSTKLKEALRE